MYLNNIDVSSTTNNYYVNRLIFYISVKREKTSNFTSNTIELLSKIKTRNCFFLPWWVRRRLKKLVLVVGVDVFGTPLSLISTSDLESNLY